MGFPVLLMEVYRLCTNEWFGSKIDFEHLRFFQSITLVKVWVRFKSTISITCVHALFKEGKYCGFDGEI